MSRSGLPKMLQASRNQGAVMERLAGPKPLDHRISYGCINVGAKFIEDVVSPNFTGTYYLQDQAAWIAFFTNVFAGK